MIKVVIGLAAWLAAMVFFPIPPDFDLRSTLLVYGSMMLGIGIGEHWPVKPKSSIR